MDIDKLAAGIAQMGDAVEMLGRGYKAVEDAFEAEGDEQNGEGIEEPIRQSDNPKAPQPSNGQPRFQVVRGVEFKKRGKFSTRNGGPKGVLVHFTAGAEDEDSHSDAIGTLKYLARKGLGCPVMDHDGTIFIPDNFDILRDWAYHAGKSSWRGISGVSAVTVGMEIVNAGKLTKFDGAYWAWYDLEYKGSKPVKAKPGKSPATDTRAVWSSKQNIKAGVYDAYTPEQEQALIDFCIWLSKNSPDFDVNWICGHDEVSPDRKSDPGGSLSMTMPELRQLIASKI